MQLFIRKCIHTKIKKTGDSRYIYQNKLSKACFQHDMAYRDFKDFTRRTASHKILRDKAFIIAKNSNTMDIKEVLLQWFITFSIKKTAGGAATLANKSTVKNENIKN